MVQFPWALHVLTIAPKPANVCVTSPIPPRDTVAQRAPLTAVLIYRTGDHHSETNVIVYCSMAPDGQTKYGHSETDWNAAKEEAAAALRRCARKKMPISYSELTAQISAIHFEPHGVPFSHFLGEISTEEHGAGRGMLTAIVIHKEGDRMPGGGFYDCAERLGLDVSDKIKLWAEQVRAVEETWAR